MLSILIPIYNYDVKPLVTALSVQVMASKLEAEILCFDDKSDMEFLQENEAIGSMPLVQYKALKNNKGRAAIRNLLAKEAQYDQLLFLDCDSGIISKDFLAEYLEHIEEQVVAGGRVYSDQAPSPQCKLLHWKYGTQKESRTLADRRKNPYIYFHSNNFMISRKLFLELGFDEGISGYGYEDLVLAKQLKEKNILIHHIENPIEHLCIEDHEAFLEKTKHAVKNLSQLNAAGLNMQTQLELAARKLRSFGMSGLFKLFYKKRQNTILKNLLSGNPNLRFLSYYKLYHYLR